MAAGGIHKFTISPNKQDEFWRGAITGAMWAFGNTLPEGKNFKWWWEGAYTNFKRWTCAVECSKDMFIRMKEYINNIIPGTVFEP